MYVFPTSGQATQSTPSVSVREKNDKNDDACGSFGGLYSDDAKNKNGAKWIECSFCRVRFPKVCG